VWGKIKKGIKKAANAVSKTVNKAADAVADVVEAVGNGINDGLSWLSDKIPDGGVLGWLGDVISGLTTLVAGAVKAVGAIVGGLLSGLIKIVGGSSRSTWTAFSKDSRTSDQASLEALSQ
jgi:hypothetical protein